MSFTAYITRDADGNEISFEHPYERQAALAAAKRLWTVYSDMPVDCALIANLQSPPIDLVVVTNYGIGVIDMKEFSADIQGDTEGEWHYVSPQNVSIGTVKAGANYPNPFHQVRDYRRRLVRSLTTTAQSGTRGLPRWLGDHTWYASATVQMTGPKVSTKGVIIDPKQSKPWFTITHLDEITDWVHSLAFGHNNQLSSAGIKFLAETIFGASRWLEIEGHFTKREPYGRLFLVDDDGALVPPGYTLESEEITIGRDPLCEIAVEGGATRVSRRHALLHYRTEKRRVYLSDNDSKHGTYLNGKRLEVGMEEVVVTGSRITLGPIGDDGRPGQGACCFVYRRAQAEDVPSTESSLVTP